MSQHRSVGSRGHHDIAALRNGHRGRYQYRGVVRADRDHSLYFRSFRAERDRQRALRSSMRHSTCIGDGVRPANPSRPLHAGRSWLPFLARRLHF